MPARKRLLRAPKKFSTLHYFKWICLGLAVVLIIFTVSKFVTKKYLLDVERVNLAIQENNGDVSIVIFDIENTEITRVMIPGNTEVKSAKNLGTFRLKKIWQLGLNEKMGGELLSKTVTKYFRFPVYVWADHTALNFISTNPINCLKPTFLPFKTNLTLGDKFTLSRLCMKVNNINHTEIDLSKSNFIKKVVLTDGEDGYILSGLPSPKLYSNFNYFDSSQENIKITIKDGSNNPNSSKAIGEVAEVLGAKVATVTKVNAENYVCVVKSQDKNIADVFSYLFGCQKSKDFPADNFDLELNLGVLFQNQF